MLEGPHYLQLAHVLRQLRVVNCGLNISRKLGDTDHTDIKEIIFPCLLRGLTIFIRVEVRPQEEKFLVEGWEVRVADLMWQPLD